MTFLLPVDEQLVDIDRAWSELVTGLAPETPVGKPSVALALAVGLRLALTYGTLARVLLARLEQRMGQENETPPEAAEETIRELVDLLLARAAVHADE